MDIDKEKEAFETWLFSTEKFKCRNKSFLFMLDDFGTYEDQPVLEHWETWQAAKTQAVPKWISVEDELPSDGQDVIAFDAIKHCVFKGGEFLQGYFEPDTGHEYTEPVDVTHWIAIEAQESAK